MFSDRVPSVYCGSLTIASHTCMWDAVMVSGGQMYGQPQRASVAHNPLQAFGAQFFAAGSAQMLPQWFQSVDTDRSGKISCSELQVRRILMWFLCCYMLRSIDIFRLRLHKKIIGLNHKMSVSGCWGWGLWNCLKVRLVAMRIQPIFRLSNGVIWSWQNWFHWLLCSFCVVWHGFTPYFQVFWDLRVGMATVVHSEYSVRRVYRSAWSFAQD